MGRATILLLLGTKLELVILEMAQQIQDRTAIVRGAPVVQSNNQFFWFNRPRWILFLIPFTLFQNRYNHGAISRNASLCLDFNILVYQAPTIHLIHYLSFKFLSPLLLDLCLHAIFAFLHYVQEVTKNIRQEVGDEVETKLNLKVYDEVDVM